MNIYKPSQNQKYYVYTLISLKDHNFYTGFTTDLKSRLIKHAKGLVISTKFIRSISSILKMQKPEKNS